jgi:hypothetical protein
MLLCPSLAVGTADLLNYVVVKNLKKFKKAIDKMGEV